VRLDKLSLVGRTAGKLGAVSVVETLIGLPSFLSRESMQEPPHSRITLWSFILSVDSQFAPRAERLEIV
jgi:hypothetical protein